MLIEPVEFFFSSKWKGEESREQIQVGEGETQTTAFLTKIAAF